MRLPEWQDRSRAPSPCRRPLYCRPISSLAFPCPSLPSVHGLNPVPKPEETWEQFLVKSPDLQKFVTEIKQQAAESDAAARQKLVDASEDHLL